MAGLTHEHEAMNPHDTDRIDPQFEALLEQALAPQGAAPGLSQRIAAAVEHELAGMDELLDEALAAPAAPAGLRQRVLKAVRRELASAGGSVIARIGWRYPASRQIAALVVMTASTGLALMAAEITRDAYRFVEAWPKLQRDVITMVDPGEVGREDPFRQDLEDVQMAIHELKQDGNLLGEFDQLLKELEESDL